MAAGIGVGGTNVAAGIGVSGTGVAVGVGVGVSVGAAAAVGKTCVGVNIGVAVDNGVAVGVVGVEMSMGNTSVGVETIFVAFVVAVSVSETLVRLGLGVGGFVSSDFGGCFVGEGSTSALTTILGSGDGVPSV